jgi:light-regulated signal transduction histidine kinase (bacteriophytochrome)
LRPDLAVGLTDDILIDEFVRNAVFRRLPDASPEEIERTVALALEVETDEEHFVPGGGWLMRSVQPTREGGRVIVLTDITGLKQAQQKLEQQAGDLQRSNIELEQFAYLASHDLQEPLRVVGSYCDLLEKRYSDQLDDQAREFIGYAVDGAQRMRSLIDDLLDYSKVGSEKIGISTFDIGDTIESSLRALHTLITENDADISWEEMPMVRGSSALMAQVFQNLIGNAIKFRTAEHPRIRISAERDGAMWKIGVADNGIGIQPEYADRVFRIFQRLHSRGEYAGNGLGLALCQRVVSRHGGEIWIETSRMRGATINFTLPALAD